jgi:hypothetical protein
VALRRYWEIVRSCQWRRTHGVPIDEAGFIRVAANLLAFMPQGSDYYTLNALAAKCGFGDLDEAAVMAAVHERVFSWPLSGETAGALLDLTAEERSRCAIRTMKAVDEPPEEAAARRAEERREYHRLYKARLRRDHGATAQADSLSRTKPWVALGISRATYYRRNQQVPRETDSSTHIDSVAVDAFVSRLAATGVNVAISAYRARRPNNRLGEARGAVGAPRRGSRPVGCGKRGLNVKPQCRESQPRGRVLVS